MYSLLACWFSPEKLVESLMCPDTDKLKAGFHSDTCQDRCPCGRTSFPKWPLPVSMSCGWAPVASCLSRKLTNIRRWISPRLLSWDFVCNLCEWGVYIPQTSDSPNSKPCLPSKPNIMLSLVQDPRLGSPVWDLAPVFLGEKLCGCCFPPVCGSLTLAYESCLYCSLASSTHLVVVPSSYLYL